MSKTITAIQYTEKSGPYTEEIRLIQVSDASTDHNYIYVMNENGACELLFQGSDEMIDALFNLIKNKGIREATTEEFKLIKKVKLF